MKEQLTNTTETLEPSNDTLVESPETWSDADAEREIEKLVNSFKEEMKREKNKIQQEAVVSPEISTSAWIKIKGQQTIDDISTSLRGLQDTVIGKLEKNKLYQKLVIGNEKYREQLAGKTEQLFGDSITITESNEHIVAKHLEHLNLIPEHFINHLKEKGLRVRVGNNDVLGLTQNKSLEENAPRGWEGTASWAGVPGCYDGNKLTAFAGKGMHGSASVALHEYGHGVGDLLGLDYSDQLVEAHIRLYNKLGSYYIQGGLGAFAGRQEMLAESFAEFHIKDKSTFIKQYDEAWHDTLSEIIRAPKDTYMNRKNI